MHLLLCVWNMTRVSYALPSRLLVVLRQLQSTELLSTTTTTRAAAAPLVIHTQRSSAIHSIPSEWFLFVGHSMPGQASSNKDVPRDGGKGRAGKGIHLEVVFCVKSVTGLGRQTKVMREQQQGKQRKCPEKRCRI